MEATADYEAIKTTLADAANEHGEPHWLVERRLAAVDAMQGLAVPKADRFSIRDWPLTPTDQPLKFSRSDRTLATDVTAEEGHIQIVQVGQTTVTVNLPDELDEQGVILTDMFTAFREHPQLTEKHFMAKVVKTDEDRLTSYHTAFLNAGVFLYVPKGVTIKAPIEINTIQDSTRTQPLVSHVLIVAEADSHFAVTQHLTTEGDVTNIANCVVEILARGDSEVHYSAFDELGANTTAYLNRRASISRGAKVDWAIGMMNNGNTFGDFDSELIGEGAKSDAKVITVTTKSQDVCINTRVTNHGKKTDGNIVQRGVIMEKSNLIFNGIGHIIHGASGAHAEQENRVLMMSDDAHGDANPILLIDENDVLAGHAASVGQIDQNQMHYLMSRGIDKAQAQRLVIRGFLSTVIGAIPSKTVRTRLTNTIERKLEDGIEL
ncbi:Fe-S cluster assembly protein SufD [Lactiplantibacillus pentosus]|uniref:Fe-S cluster assembly protein SufD n=1 Tax=Lactiplantibacillus pentosus TaxID=1589 RepID=UPI0021A362B3|nr:Fe-S cluster assembly protein SufD [Lactiplantibacillus pentosus]MCT3328659.1 Fe-S cluster assembly protein SufD [Lactiplantibacillus pentosus]